jgi:hypothetical protein
MSVFDNETLRQLRQDGDITLREMVYLMVKNKEIKEGNAAANLSSSQALEEPKAQCINRKPSAEELAAAKKAGVRVVSKITHCTHGTKKVATPSKPKAIKKSVSKEKKKKEPSTIAKKIAKKTAKKTAKKIK